MIARSSPPKASWTCLSRRRLMRSEEHTSELQSRLHLVCRLLLEKKKKIRMLITIPLTLSNLKLLRRITRMENISHIYFTRSQVDRQDRLAYNIRISSSTLSVNVL